MMTSEQATEAAETLLLEAAMQADLVRMATLNGIADSWLVIASLALERESAI